jgi:hypothetical protein
MKDYRILYIKLKRNSRILDSNDYIARAHFNISNIWNIKNTIDRNNKYYNIFYKSLPHKNNIFKQNTTRAIP